MRQLGQDSGLQRLSFQFALILAVAMAPAGVLAVIQALTNVDDAIGQRLELLAADVRKAAEEEQSVFLSIRETLRIAARELKREIDETGACARSLSLTLGNDPRLTGGALLDADGIAVCGDARALGIAGNPAWLDFLDRPRFVIGAPQENPADGTAFVTAFYPMADRTPEAFAISVGIDLTFLRGLVASDLTPRPFAVLGQGGAVLAIGGAEGGGWLPKDRKPLLSFTEGDMILISADGIERRFFVMPLIAGQVWAVTSSRELGFGALVGSAQGLLVVAPILLWLIAVMVAAATIDRLVTRHVRYLERVAARLGRGELDTEIEELDAAPTEIRNLGEAIRVMARNLAERESALQEMVASQKSLLLEVHHRVKNNLQMVSSLMNMQLRRSESEAERRSLRLVQDRIHGLALVHQNLYATERLDSIPLDHLLRDLCEHLTTSLKPARASVRFESALEPITVGTEVATPIALFMTEAVSNIFKHAVGGTGQTVIRLGLARQGDNFQITLENDLGPAMRHSGGPQVGAPLDRSSGLGARLMEGFARQIGGTLTRETVDDTVYRVTLTGPLGGHAATAPGAFELRHREETRDAAE
ncbi:HAMP domain-containing protein [Limibaculum sp. M0105]|uniref:histidine kinase n=1 Tax=Thermohalobaculum xanthum TaxID=2753746 RepID=A0A8J7SG16_9RHOB|nr:sensor histidine kinase [Thermohalobaculum xanthum]MBK0398780.1 HAMP domain-containing protein [Thermohalobaculum xanthum]